jgi:predicted P-loop ATPase
VADSSSSNKTISFSVGEAYNLGRARPVTESVLKFEKRFVAPLVTPEKYREYKKASDKKQRHLKTMAGWYIRAPLEKKVRNRNSIKPSDVITLDIDYATPAFMEDLAAGKILSGYRMMAHTTRSHTPEKPRCRIIVYLKGQCPRERYQAASRIVAQLADPQMVYVDKVSFRPAQLMYFPTVSSDMEKHYVFYSQPGQLLDHEEVIADWESINGSADDIGNLPRTKDEDELREAAEEAEDPLSKEGIVGDFCRAWSMTELIVGKEDGTPGPLADIYEPTEWAEGAVARATYMHGSTSNGACFYDDKFCFSHHGSDPAQEQLLNAFDLVRIHLYADKDAGEEKDTPIMKLPSSKAMIEWCRTDPFFREQQAESRYDLDAKFEDDDVEVDEEEDEEDAAEGDDFEDIIGVPESSIDTSAAEKVVRRRVFADKPPKRWIATQLELTDDGIIKKTSSNFITICTNDPRMWRKIAFNEFSNEVVLLDDIKTKNKLIPEIKVKDRVNGDRWQDYMDLTIRAIIDGPPGKNKPGYGISVGKDVLADCIKITARNNSFHPIREYLLDCRERLAAGADLEEVVGGFLIRHIGAEDNIYTRQIMIQTAMASVARIFEPGHKFDFAIIIEGGQGIGKSTLIRLLYGREYFGELHSELKDAKKAAEAMQGNWVMELPELSAMHKSDHNDVKAFMRRVDDDVRLSYDRHVSVLPRQTVFWGTTNDSQYLRDPTGNRSFWPVVATTDSIDFAAVMRERDLFWACATQLYLAARERRATGDLDLSLRGEALTIARRMQSKRRKMEMWESWKERIADWMEEPIPLRTWLSETRGQAAAEGETFKGHPVDDTWVQRIAFTQEMAFKLALEQYAGVATDNVKQMAWDQIRSAMAEEGWDQRQCKIGQSKRRWIIVPDATSEERSLGFRVSSPPEGWDDSGPEGDEDDFTDDDLI